MSAPWLTVAQSHVGLREIPGPKHNPKIVQWLVKLGAWWREIPLIRPIGVDVLRNGALRGPFQSNNAVIKRRATDAIFAGGFGECDPLAKNVVTNTRSLVQFLRRPWNPSAVLRRVGSVIVNAVEGVTVRAQAHVSQKIHKRISPSVTHDNTAPSVVRIFFAVSGVASPPHLNPTSGGRRVGETVFRDLRARDVFARGIRAIFAHFRFSGFQIAKQNDPLCAAVAATESHSSSGLKNRPPIELHGDDYTSWGRNEQGKDHV